MRLCLVDDMIGRFGRKQCCYLEWRLGRSGNCDVADRGTSVGRQKETVTMVKKCVSPRQPTSYSSAYSDRIQEAIKNCHEGVP
jgi:hypothetical protein